jgi:hypothetical protein
MKANEKCATLIVVNLIISTNKTEVCLLSIMSDLIEIYKLSQGHAVAQLVEALLYKTEGRGLDSGWCH